MAFIPAANGMKVELLYTLVDSNAVNVLWVRDDTGVPDTAALEATAETFQTDFWNILRPQLTNLLQLNFIRVTRWMDADDIQHTRTVGTNGTVGTGSLPANCACVLSWQTGLTGRSRRGRTYLPGIPEEAVIANTMTPALLTVFANAAISLTSELALIGLKLVVASFINDNLPRSSALLTPITEIAIDSRIDTQRRRLPGYWT